MGLATHGQRAITGWTLGLNLLHLSRIRVLNDGFGQATHEVLTQLPHNGGEVGQAHRLVIQMGLQAVEPLIKMTHVTAGVIGSNAELPALHLMR